MQIDSLFIYAENIFEDDKVVSFMKLHKDFFMKVIIFIFISTQVFAFSFSFTDMIYSTGTWQQTFIDNMYMLRNISFILSIVCIFISKKITIDDILVIGFICLSYILMCIVFPENKKYFEEIQPILKYAVTAYIAVRTHILKFGELKKYIVFVARAITILLTIVVLSNSFSLIMNSAYMEFANSMSIGLALMFYSGIIDSKIYDFVIALIGSIVLLMYGSRGSLLTIGILVVYLLWLKYKNKKIVIVGIFGAVILIIMGPLFMDVLLKYLVKVGINSRSIEKLISGNFLKSNDRLSIYKYLIGILGKNLFVGVGICGDRYWLPKHFSGMDATYTHNLFLEILLDYGILIGGLIIAISFYLLFKCLIREKNLEKKSFFSVFFFVSYVQLMISRSWITEQNLFILFALLLTYSTSKRIHFVIKRNNK